MAPNAVSAMIGASIALITNNTPALHVMLQLTDSTLQPAITMPLKATDSTILALTAITASKYRWFVLPVQPDAKPAQPT